ncbi:MAG: acetyl-CoA carboxylase biotin carboxylase subunit [Chloroflexi bacterium]|nr:acetyl-CoA carboxylase biotin carboxylase subunit [Chloroflexota bacterium]
MFRKILVANRGEIALRIMRTCEDMRIPIVAIYSDADRISPHVPYADEAYHIGPPPPLESYLDIDRVLAAAKKSGADAIHPGYGFLAENPNFADACEKAGIAFIGPNAEMIRRMGDKLEARRLMQKAGVPIVPGGTVEADSVETVKSLALEVGYPVLVKPSGGGGGKGMHVVHKEEDLESALRLASSEAASTFGNPTVYIEKYLSPVRHIEVQMVRDNHGGVIHLGERECSVQRRHQKIIEESPSTAITEPMREAMVEAATAAVNSVDYSGVGTIEFLLDASGNFYFLEMNTRLQVEHTVTEQVTGLDLVEEQILVASGERLRHKQADVTFSGWAIECRVSAEDPYNGFLPSPGVIEMLYEPGGPGVRVDTGVSKGYEVPIFYDPLIAKLITWGRDRDQAIRRMHRALRDYKILGIHNNIPFLMAIIRHRKFLQGAIHTEFLDENTDLFEQEPKLNAEYAAVVAALLDYTNRGTPTGNGDAPLPSDVASAWKRAGLTRSWDKPWG